MTVTEELSRARGELFPMLLGYIPAQVAHALARLEVADRLADGPATAERLAARTGTHAPSLYRLLRAAASLGLVTLADGRFELTGTGQLLRAGVPGSVRNLVLLFAGDPVWRSWSRLEHSVRTGETAFEHLHGTNSFGYFAAHPDEEAVFNEAMAEHTREVAPDVVARCGLAATRRIADLGGGNGTLLAAFLAALPEATGVLHDTASGHATPSGCSPGRVCGTAARSSPGTSSPRCPPAATPTC